MSPLVTERALGAIDRQSIRLAALVARLLDVSRLDTSRLILQCCPVALDVIAEGVVAGARVRSAHHVFAVHAPEPVVATVVAYVWLAETLAPAQLVGGALVLAAIALAQTAR